LFSDSLSAVQVT